MRPAFSIIIPTYNRRESLRRCLDSLASQDGDTTFEVIIVDDGSTDGTLEMLAQSSFPYPLSVYTIEHAGPAAARNRGVAEARGDYLLFIDDDVIAHTGLLAAHAGAHRTEGNAVIIGVMAAPADEELPSWGRWEQEVLDKQYEAMTEGRWKPSPRQFYTANASLARERFRMSRGFDPDFRRAEDVELAYRLRDMGLKFVFRPDAVVTHYAHRTIRSWWNVPYQYGIYDVRMARTKRRFILNIVAREFPRRHLFVQHLIRLLVARGGLARPVAAAAVGAGVAAGYVRWRRLARSAFSLAFNLLYYQGLRDELGSAMQFRRLITNGTGEHSFQAAKMGH